MATGDNKEQFVVRAFNVPNNAERFVVRVFNVPNGVEQFTQRVWAVPNGVEQFFVNTVDHAEYLPLEFPETIVVNNTLDNSLQLEYTETTFVGTILDNQLQLESNETTVFNATLDEQPSSADSTIFFNIIEGTYVPPDTEPEPEPTAPGSILWADGEGNWYPARIWDGNRFSCYNMWDGTKWIDSCASSGYATQTVLMLRPTLYYNPDWGYEQSWTGGVDALRDGSDSTYAHLRVSNVSNSTLQSTFIFDPIEVPDGFVPKTMYLTMRAREFGNPARPNNNYYFPYMTADIRKGLSTDGWGPGVMESQWHNALSPLSTPPLSTTFQNYDSRDHHGLGGTSTVVQLPSVEDIRAGLVEGYMRIFDNTAAGGPTTYDYRIEVAELTIYVCSDDTGDPE